MARLLLGYDHYGLNSSWLYSGLESWKRAIVEFKPPSLLGDHSLGETGHLLKYFLPNFVALFLSFNQQVYAMKSDEKEEKNLPTREWLTLKSNNITNRQMKILESDKLSSLTVRVESNWIRIFLAVGSLTSLKTLNVHYAQLVDTKFLSSGNFSSLTKLSLRGNTIGDRGVQYLVTGNLSPLNLLILESAEIGVGGAKALAACSDLSCLTELNLSNNKIGPEAAKFLSRALFSSSLTTLNLEGNNIGATGASHLAYGNFTGLTSLNLSKNMIKDAGMQSLARVGNLTSLQCLNLTDNGIENIRVSHLADTCNLSSLTFLNLRANGIGDRGVSFLAATRNLSSLTRLNLSWNRITDNGARRLAAADFPKLTLLDLSDNYITQAAHKIWEQKYSISNIHTSFKNE